MLDEETENCLYSSESTVRFFSTSVSVPLSVYRLHTASNKAQAIFGFKSAHIEVLGFLLINNIFRDFFNVFNWLPVHSHLCLISQPDKGFSIKFFPLERNTRAAIDTQLTLIWLYSNRLPFFLKSRLYHLSVFTFYFCEDNEYLKIDEDYDYSVKQLTILSELETVDGIHKLIRYAGCLEDGTAIQLWLDLELLLSTNEEHGYQSLMDNIYRVYSSSECQISQHFQDRLTDAIELINQSRNRTRIVTTRENMRDRYKVLCTSPFLPKDARVLSTIQETEGNPIVDLQKDIMKDLRQNFCKRYLSYYNCLHPKFAEKPNITVDDEIGTKIIVFEPITTKDSLRKVYSRSSGYILSNPDDRLAAVVRKQIPTLERSLSETTFRQPIRDNDEDNRSRSMIEITQSEVTVNKKVLERCRYKVITFNKTVPFNDDNIRLKASDVPSNRISVAFQAQLRPLESEVPICVSALSSTNSSHFSTELPKISKDKNTSPSEKKRDRRLSRINNFINNRKSSSCFRKESLKTSNSIDPSDELISIEKRSSSVQLKQDKIRLYIAIIASDVLAGGPFRHFLACRNMEEPLEHLSMWEKIEVLRCFASEGGRRGAMAKYFGGNGFLSNYNEWPDMKDDSYREYEAYIQFIKNHKESLADFDKKFKTLKAFLCFNNIAKPFNIEVISKYTQKLEVRGITDEVLAIIQQYLTNCLKDHIDDYYTFDSVNFYSCIAQKNIFYTIPVCFKAPNTTEDAFFRNHRMNRKNCRSDVLENNDIYNRIIFSPTAKRTWIVMDICEKLHYPFVSKDLSPPMLTMVNFIRLKVKVLRRKKLLQLNEQKISKNGTVTLEKKKKEPKFFSIDWDELASNHYDKLQHIITNLKDSVKIPLRELAPPSIEDLLRQDPHLKVLRRHINIAYSGNKKEAYLQLIHFFLAQEEIALKKDEAEISELCKATANVFLFSKNNLFLNLIGPIDRSDFVYHKRAHYTETITYIGVLARKVLYQELWPEFISKTYLPTKINYEQFEIHKEIKKWSRRPGIHPHLAQILMAYVIKFRGLVSFLRSYENFDDFRNFLSNLQRQYPNYPDKKISIYTRKDVDDVKVFVNRLIYDLYFFCEIFCYRNILSTYKSSIQNLTFDGTELKDIVDKSTILISNFFQSGIPPKLQINITEEDGNEAAAEFTKQNFQYSTLNTIAGKIFRVLSTLWQRYNIIKYVPESDLKKQYLKAISHEAIRSSRHGASKIAFFKSPCIVSIGKAMPTGTSGYSFSLSQGLKQKEGIPKFDRLNSLHSAESLTWLPRRSKRDTFNNTHYFKEYGSEINYTRRKSDCRSILSANERRGTLHSTITTRTNQ